MKTTIVTLHQRTGVQDVQHKKMPRFTYNDKEHEYLFDKGSGNAEMTGVTTVLNIVGDSNGLCQYNANYAAAKAFELGTPDGFVEALNAGIKRYGKLTSDLARELDKTFPSWKEARTAANKNTRAAAKRGTDNHLLCELWEKGQEVEMTPEVLEYKKWYEQNVAKTYFVERPLFSREWFVAGTPDGGFLLKNGQNLINDKKFKDSIFDNKPHWQMAAYRKMIEEMRGDTETEIVINWADGTQETYRSPQEYLKSFGDVQWDGSVVLPINKHGVEPLYRYAFEEDKKSFEAALWNYKHLKN